MLGLAYPTDDRNKKIMSDLFVDPNAYDLVYDNDETKANVMRVRRKMGFGTRARLQNELYNITVDTKDGGAAQMQIGIQLQELLLLAYNVVDWHGPRFMRPKMKQARDPETKKPINDPFTGDPVMEVVTNEAGDPVMIPIVCTRANIELLDPGDPFVAKVLKRISSNNTPKTAPAPAMATAENEDGGNEEGETPDPLA